MDSPAKGVCGRCRRFQPHDLFAFLGVCTHTNQLLIRAPAKRTCDAFEAITQEAQLQAFSRRGWLRCHSCKRVLFTVEELKTHRDDEVGSDVFADVVASEEAPTAS